MYAPTGLSFTRPVALGLHRGNSSSGDPRDRPSRICFVFRFPKHFGNLVQIVPMLPQETNCACIKCSYQCRETVLAFVASSLTEMPLPHSARPCTPALVVNRSLESVVRIQQALQGTSRSLALDRANSSIPIPSRHRARAVARHHAPDCALLATVSYRCKFGVVCPATNGRNSSRFSARVSLEQPSGGRLSGLPKSNNT